MADDFSDPKSDTIPLRIRQKKFTSGHLVGFMGEIPDLFDFFSVEKHMVGALAPSI